MADPFACMRCRNGRHNGKRGQCSYCGSTPRYPVRRRSRGRKIGGKRGRNSGVTNKAKSK